MVQVQIGRVGGELHTFDYEEDILTGKLKAADIFPEMKDNPLPPQIASVLVSGVERKFWEHTYALQGGGYNMGIYLPPYVIPQKVFEDDKEAQKTQVDIAAAKLHTGFITPFTNYIEGLTKAERKKFLLITARKMGVEHPGHILAHADDRNAIIDNIYLEHLYGDLRDHSNSQVREIFTSGHGVPGKRVKEVTSAQYGVANSIYKFNKVTEELELRGVKFSSMKRMDTTLCYKPLMPGQLAFPEEGIIVNAIGASEPYKKLTAEDFLKIKEGRILTFDHVNAVDYPGVPSETTLHVLKDSDPRHPYLRNVSSPGVAATAFAEVMGVQKAEQPKKIFVSAAFNDNVKTKGPKTVLSSARFITVPPKTREVRQSLNLPEGMRLSKEQGFFSSLKDLEQKLMAGQAFVIQDPDQFDVPQDHGMTGKKGKKVSDDDIRLLRRLETDLIYAYVITMSTQSGAPNHFARPHMVEKSFFDKYGLWHTDMANLGLTGDVESEAYRVYASEEELEAGLNSWDPQYYDHNPKRPKNGYINESCVKECLGRDDLGFVVATYGSASSYLDTAYRDAHDMVYALSKRQNVMTIDGGGVRSAMLGMKDGALKALAEGYDVLNLGIRSESDVSPLEGNVEKWIEERGFEPVAGNNEHHIHFADEHMHVFKLSRLLQRQAPIAAMSHASVIVPGGKGTMVEALISMLHNARVDILGEGLFPCYSRKDQKKPILFSNHQFDCLGEERGVFDGFLQNYRNDFDRLGIHEFKEDGRIQEMDQFLVNLARENGYDISEQRLGREMRHPVIFPSSSQHLRLG